ncbi:unnamed protein product [Didymodactylos carnosus]|uniref:Reverse transcriptase domain-containing protein n=1 Tax=Didymodactylos carnosus TaxID=1234261 RepID=A0A815TG11_9BILA|nr:unnamed protein product [Didymodactylos carnosus]CAF4368965.1 unnamed protein product [Didymodactylos carnosus]
MLPQEESIFILKKFLDHFGYYNVQRMSIEAVEQLARIVLTENVFIYEDTYYRQVVGGAMGSPFTLTLANIFMWHWERQFVEHQRQKNELYGRYIDDIFFTSDDSIDEINRMLNEANSRHPNIKITSPISNPTSFLDVQVENVNGKQLLTSVYHKEAAEPCLYSITSTSIIPMIHDENEFSIIRCRLLDATSVQEHQRAARLAEQFNFVDIPPNIDPLVKEKLLKRKERADSIIIHYTYEQRFADYGRKIHQLWDNVFHGTPLKQKRVIVGTRNNPNLSKELICRNPFKKQKDIRDESPCD